MGAPNRTIAWLVVLGLLGTAGPLCAQDGEPVAPRGEEPLVEVSRKARHSVAAIGSYRADDTPSIIYHGTGFVIADGNTVVTNAHVVAGVRKRDRMDHLRVFFIGARSPRGREARVVAEDPVHDVALLRFEGAPEPPMQLAPKDSELEPQGRSIAIMGYPVGLKLGLVPAVHRGVISAAVPAVLPLPKGTKLTDELREVLDNPYNLYQLDIVAMPGNSGSPLFNARTGEVIGIINKVLGSRTREHLISHPSGISYAVPSRWIHVLVIRAAASAERTEDAGGQR